MTPTLPLLKRKAEPVVVLIAAVAAITSFWIRTGLNMYPLDDGWVSSSFGNPKFDIAHFLLTNSRELRNLPFILANAIDPNNFRAINAILIGINVLTFLGLFRICRYLLPGRIVAAFMAASLAMMFPNDHTMFWLGAFGVNLSYLLLVWSTVAAFAAIEGKRPWLHLASLVLLFCGIKTYPGYIFLPLVLVSGFLFMHGGARAYLRGFARHILPQWLIFVVALVPTVRGMMRGSGREGHVASMDIGQVFAGYREMFANLLWRWYGELWPIARWMVPYAIFFVVLFAVAVLLLHRFDKRIAPRYSNRIALIAICAALVLLCYVPYSVSDIRFDHARALIASRFGLVVMLVAIVDWWQLRYGRPFTAAGLCAGGVALLTLFCLNRLSFFDARHERSIYQRILLADLADAVPCPAPDTPILLVIRQGEFSDGKGGKMLINRPQYLLRTVYANDEIDAYTVSNWLLGAHGRIDPADGTIVYRRRDIGPEPLLLHYEFATGVKHVMRARFRIGPDRRWVTITGSRVPASSCNPTPLANALVQQRDEYLDHLKLPYRKPRAAHPQLGH